MDSSFSLNVGMGTFNDGLIRKMALEENWLHHYFERWATIKHFKLDHFKANYPEVLVLASDFGSANMSLVLKTKNGVVEVAQRGLLLTIDLFAPTQEQAQDMVRWFKSNYKESTVDDQKIRANFWYDSPRGPTYTSRDLDAPTFEDIRLNYTPEVRDELAKFLNKEWRPASAGQLMVWFGPPGCGKTYAIRALVREWSQWCRMAYVTDPERFLGDANYMMSVVLDDPEDRPDPYEYDKAVGAKHEPWNLVILEDSGELVGKDAKTRTGQGLSRLLNLTDGFIGQGLRVLVLITTNEESHELHDAINRPGRCLSRLEFNALNSAEAQRWLDEHNSGVVANRPYTLAELYATLRGDKPKAKKGIGFGV